MYELFKLNYNHREQRIKKVLGTVNTSRHKEHLISGSDSFYRTLSLPLHLLIPDTSLGTRDIEIRQGPFL